MYVHIFLNELPSGVVMSGSDWHLDRTNNPQFVRMFDPLNDDRDAACVLKKAQSLFESVGVWKYGILWECKIEHEGRYYKSEPTEFGRAIVIAALRAKGVEVV